MPRNRKLMGALAFSVALAGGGAAGALLGTPSVSGAQEAEDGTTTTEDGGRPRGPRHHLRAGFEVAAQALGMTVDELRTELEGGSTIAEVAAARGVDVNSVIAALVADANARIDAAVAAGDIDAEQAARMKENLTERMTAFVEGELRGGPGGPGRGHHRLVDIDVAAEALGLTVEELRTELGGGASIADVAEARGVDVQTVIDALVADASAELTERITAFVNGERPEGPVAEED